MKTTFISSALLFFTVVLSAQTSSKPSTVHIKQVKNINGVETITDTTYTTNDPSSVKIDGGTISIIDSNNKTVSTSKTIIINDDGDDEITKQEIPKIMERELVINEHINDSIDLTGKTLILRSDKYKGNKEIFGGGDQIEIFIVSKVNVTDACESDKKRLKDQTDGKLKIEKMNFYPNPNSGKFNLSFSLPEKGDTEISILNIDGKIVYKEKMAEFSGNYDKEIDISKNAKGVYFVKVEQGKHAQVKKIILE